MCCLFLWPSRNLHTVSVEYISHPEYDTREQHNGRRRQARLRGEDEREVPAERALLGEANKDRQRDHDSSYFRHLFAQQAVVSVRSFAGANGVV